MVIRDFIPEGEKPTAEEIQRSAFLSRDWGNTKSGVKPDFIPGPDHLVARPRETQDEIHKRISEAVVRRGETELQDTYKRAQRILPTLNVMEAIAAIEQQPGGLQGVWLLAEEQGRARKTVLTRFMHPEDELRERLGIEEMK